MPSQPFQRTIGLSTAISLVIGTIIGSGIFIRPAEMAALLRSPMLILLVWIIGGVFTLFSAMVIAEIAAMLPETGGQYAFMRHMYGEFWAYVYGWANFAVMNTAGTAGIAFICSKYSEYFFRLPRFSPAIERSFVLHVPVIGDIFPLEDFGVKVLTVLLLTILTFTSYISTKLGGGLQVFFTVTKILAIGLLVGGLFFSGKGSFSNFSPGSPSFIPAGFAVVAALFAAWNGALQAYDGCSNMVVVAGEIKNPGKNIPRSLLIGLFTCMVIYIAVTCAMMFILPVDVMAESSLVASDAARVAFGNIGGGVIALLICLTVLGTTNASVMSPPRMTFAMAREGKFFPFAGKVHPRYNTPGNALLLHLCWMVVLVFSGSFFILADMYIFILWLFNLLIISGLFILRKKMPNASRPYRVWGYPWMPVLLIVFNASYLVMTVYNDVGNYLSGKTHIINSFFGLVLTAVGVPLYWWFGRNKRNEKSEPFYHNAYFV